eukprot:12892567-Prorocentrum_lima.AAC.1
MSPLAYEAPWLQSATVWPLIMEVRGQQRRRLHHPRTLLLGQRRRGRAHRAIDLSERCDTHFYG